MSRRLAIAGLVAVLFHATLLFAFRVVTPPVLRPVGDTTVEVSLIDSTPPSLAAIQENTKATPMETPPPESPPTPIMPEKNHESAPDISKSNKLILPVRPTALKKTLRSAVSSRADIQNSATLPARNTPTTSARPIFNPKPIYPALARRERQQGRVILALQINTAGHVTNVSLVRSSGFPLLDAAALQSVRRWSFVPAQVAGLAIPSKLEVPITFSLTH